MVARSLAESLVLLRHEVRHPIPAGRVELIVNQKTLDRMKELATVDVATDTEHNGLRGYDLLIREFMPDNIVRAVTLEYGQVVDVCEFPAFGVGQERHVAMRRQTEALADPGPFKFMDGYDLGRR
jgi:hypothetical protein